MYETRSLKIKNLSRHYLSLPDRKLSPPSGPDLEHSCDIRRRDDRMEFPSGKQALRLGDWFAHRFELYLRTQGSYTKAYVDVDAPL